MRRRAFIAGLGGAAASSAMWPRASRAQQASRMPLIGFITSGSEGDAQTRADHAAFTEMLAKLGWTDGRNVTIAYRWDSADDGRVGAAAAGLVSESADVIVVTGTPATAVLKRQTSLIPIVFVTVADPVASGFVASFAHPGGNITGFTSVEFSFAGKWLSLLKDIVPGIANVMVLYSPQNPNWTGYLGTIEAAAQALHVTIRAAPVATAAAIAPEIEAFARRPGAGMLVVPSGLTVTNREMIAALAVRHHLPAIYPYRYFAASGGLASYGSDATDLYRRAAQYVDRILRGAKPGDLPVQAPTKFEFVINLKAAKAIGLMVPEPVLLLADEVIE
jgi:putative tryptophan/tyrosine transport system substrate-binding protein